MILKNYLDIFLAEASKKVGRGKYYRKKLYSTERILNKNYPLKDNFKFLQVGANDGKSFDFLFSFVIERNTRGIVIEPVKDYYNELCENYKNYNEIKTVNKAIHKNELSITIYKIVKYKLELYPDWVKGIASTNKSHLLKFDIINEAHISEEIVEADKLMNIIKCYDFDYFDYFQIDTEGYDFEVLSMFDFTKYKPSMIKAEFINLTSQEKIMTKKILTNNGYYIFFEGLDIIGVDLNKIKL
jgi:FkbM family methyltransferase